MKKYLAIIMMICLCSGICACSSGEKYSLKSQPDADDTIEISEQSEDMEVYMAAGKNNATKASKGSQKNNKLQKGSLLYKSLNSEYMENIMTDKPVKIFMLIDHGGDQSVAYLTKEEDIDEFLSVFSKVKIGKETNEVVTDNYNGISFTFSDGEEVSISLNLKSLEIYSNGKYSYYELDKFDKLWKLINSLVEDPTYSAPAYEVYGDYEEVPIYMTWASTWLDEDTDYERYHPDNLSDHDPATAYVEGAEKNGIGQMVDFEFGEDWEAETRAITRIEIRPGYQKSKDTFINNSRPTKLGFYFPNGRREIVELGSDYDKDAVFTIDIDPVITNKCIMIIEDAVDGKKYKDCCISEVTFYEQETDGPMFYEWDINYDNWENAKGAEYQIDAYEGDELRWSYLTNNPLTEITGSAFLASGYGKVMLHDDGKIVAIDAYTGDVLWENEDTGYPSAVSFDDEGNFFVCSYYGNSITVIDPDGETIWDEDNLAGDNVDYSWATMLALKEDRVMSIYYAYNESPEDNGIVFTTEY